MEDKWIRNSCILCILGTALLVAGAIPLSILYWDLKAMLNIVMSVGLIALIIGAIGFIAGVSDD